VPIIPGVMLIQVRSPWYSICISLLCTWNTGTLFYLPNQVCYFLSYHLINLFIQWPDQLCVRILAESDKQYSSDKIMDQFIFCMFMVNG
jgi:hypothetical protein